MIPGFSVEAEASYLAKLAAGARRKFRTTWQTYGPLGLHRLVSTRIVNPLVVIHEDEGAIRFHVTIKNLSRRTLETWDWHISTARIGNVRLSRPQAYLRNPRITIEPRSEEDVHLEIGIPTPARRKIVDRLGGGGLVTADRSEKQLKVGGRVPLRAGRKELMRFFNTETRAVQYHGRPILTLER